MFVYIYMYSHRACDVMKERTLYLLKPSSLIWHLMPYLFLFNSLGVRSLLVYMYIKHNIWSSVVECLPLDQGVDGSSLTSVTALCP